MSEQRRGFLQKSFMGALGAGLAAGVGSRAMAQSGPDDPAIVTKQEWQTTLGKPVAVKPYGTPSIYEEYLQRRESPGLTQTSVASVSFAPLQGFLE